MNVRHFSGRSNLFVIIRVDSFVKEHDIDCEWTPRPTFDVCLSDEFTAYSNTAYDNVIKRGGATEVKLHIGDDAPTVSAMSDQRSDCPMPTNLLNLTWHYRSLKSATRPKPSNGQQQRSILRSFVTLSTACRLKREATVSSLTLPLSL